MPACQGLPDGPCPRQKCDASVIMGWGELMLCKECDSERFRRETKTQAINRPTTRSNSSSTMAAAAGGALTDVQQNVAPPPGINNSNGTVSRSVLTSNGSVEQRNGEPVDSSSNSISTDNHSAVNSASVVSDTKFTINELLSYLQFYRDKGNSAGLHRIVKTFYTAKEISIAKSSLISEFKSKLTNCPFIVERRNSSVRQASDAEIEDILSILETLDDANVLKSVVFVAANHDRIPRYGPEELNICTVVDKQISIDGRIDEISHQFAGISTRSEQMISELTAHYTELDQKLSSLVDSVNKLSQQKQSSPCHVAPLSTPVGAARPASNKPPAPTIDRSKNIVIFGIAESNSDEWHSKLNTILHTVIDREPSNLIEDAFRLGKYNSSSKNRPILVKLKSTWDKRIILNNSHNLSKYPEYKSSVFIRSDESVEVRRKSALKALYQRAHRQGKDAVITDDVLYVDGIAVYSIDAGRVNVASAAAASSNGSSSMQGDDGQNV